MTISYATPNPTMRADESMDDPVVLVTAMAEKCKAVLTTWDRPAPELPAAVRPPHLEWMSEQVQQPADSWPLTKAHRWLGFIQGGLVANGILDLEGAASMFDDSKNAHTTPGDDLFDHLDPGSAYRIDLGGES